MDENSFRERVHAAYLKALDKFSQSDIGRDIGASADSMRGFKARKSLGKQSLADLERWLAAHGYLDAGAGGDPAGPAESERVQSLFTTIANDLRAVADKLESSLPPKVRIQAFHHAVEDYYRDLEPIAELLKKDADVQ